MRAFPKNSPKLPFVRVGIIQKLRKQQMWRDGDIALVHGKPAVASGSGYVSFDITGIGRADVDDRPERTTGALFFTFLSASYAVGSRIAFAFDNRHSCWSPPFRADIEKGVHLCFPLEMNA
jgi:hypothetical protein